jgi:hypothetical protein
MFPIAVTLGLLVMAPTLAASQAAKMTGQDQTASGPTLYSAKSAKMHGAADMPANVKRRSMLRGRADLISPMPAFLRTEIGEYDG